MRVIKKGFLCLALTCVFCLANMATALASFEYGDNGPEVLAIQKRLVELKYEIKLLDGDFGSETEAAVKRFQADQQLEVDGIIGEATYTALMQKPMPPNRSGRSATVRNVIRAAYGVIGTPYVFGGTSVYGFDCSGFTQYAFARAGISLPRTADVQMYSGPVALRYLSWQRTIHPCGFQYRRNGVFRIYRLLGRTLLRRMPRYLKTLINYQ